MPVTGGTQMRTDGGLEVPVSGSDYTPVEADEAISNDINFFKMGNVPNSQECVDGGSHEQLHIDNPAPPVPRELLHWSMPPTEVKYDLEELIGVGSYGEVARARERASGRIVAIKRIKRLFHNATDAKRILREIALLRQLHHPNVIKLLDILPPPVAQRGHFEELYLVFEHMATDLEHLLHPRRSTEDVLYLNDQDVVGLMRDMVEGVQYLHAHHAVHRDLKPANILVDTRGHDRPRLKICDFGLMRNLDPTTPSPSPAAVSPAPTPGGGGEAGGGGGGRGF